ncbi:hypothetical protein OG746_45360 [Streptomyces sp. NBC_01016]|uniref:hypothetical protein n=1 Tax=Streptomyces sp. NBC_01016 TaxID=2903720 RepID=UPI00225B9D23|nr:hypothetical protein [Streptomyces sp. NBC_01016]MCX4832318.1 hypothetical protein [Streptomyces sp. NBC_01016]MCX4835942.1 hypothetical protein [Streptomyces sp. NBC_01016]
MIKRLKKLGAMPATTGGITTGGIAAGGVAAGGVGGSTWSGFGSDVAVVMPWRLWALLGAVLCALFVATVKNIRDALRLAKANR